jgi:hypothetical protein
MGCCLSLCPNADERNASGQFEALVVPKPQPVQILDIPPEPSDPSDGIPFFAPAPSDDDDMEISDVEVLPDSDSPDPAPVKKKTQ